ncbi:MAG: hypothetical protein ISR96_04975 [Nitrospira sp.]|nr:hypothetical protein [Candidatus Brocadiales bacterium]MBL7048856.1 hypothetical protein [Nitrospira sp.]
MNLQRNIFMAILALLICFPGYAHSIPAFPGAEGFGKDSVGGRGGIVVHVTNLNDYGPGSLREAVEAPPRHYANNVAEWESSTEYEARVSAGNTRPRHYPNGTWKNELEPAYLTRMDSIGHRIVVFDVSGIINLEDDLNITYPFMTIAGETSPGGILVTGRQTTIKAHDIIMRHMRFRVGSHRIADGADPELLDSLDIYGKYWSGVDTAYNIIIDHSSISWGVDETFTISGGVRNTTVQWSIISEGLANAGHPKGQHSKGLMVSGKYVYDNTVSLHHNYIAHNNDRNPLVEGPPGVDITVDVVNNVIYNFNVMPMGLETPKINWTHNYAKQGPSSSASFSAEVTHYDLAHAITPAPLLYVAGNIGSTRLSQSEPHWNVGWYYWNQPTSTDWKRDTAWSVPPITTQEMSASVANCILTGAGATAPVRDSVDTRVIADFSAGSGQIIDDITYPDDFPTFATPAVQTDTDNDGMPDSWELSHKLDKNTDDSAGDADSDGYTNIEEYLHYLSAKSYAYNSECMPASHPPGTPINLRLY